MTVALTTMAKAMANHHREPNDWPAYLGLAKAALIAIKEPTREMQEAIRPFLHPDWVTYVDACYEVMIAAAMGDPGPELPKEEVERRLRELVETIKRLQR